MKPSSSTPSPSVAQPPDDYAAVHRKRLELSLKWLAPFLADADVYDLGGHTEFTSWLKAAAQFANASQHDLRYPRAEIPSNRWDVVVCMEVIEHVNDGDGFKTEWHGDGALTMLSEAFRILKPGGVLFLTTPNAASITAIHHALRLAPPMIYRPHVREYVPYELDELVRVAGFTIERRETLDVWRNAIGAHEHAALARFIAERGYPRELRGEDIFLLARKPAILETAKPQG